MIIPATPEAEKKKQKWVKKWEPHGHCQVCGIAVPVNKQFCSTRCSGEYFQWKKKKEKKSKWTTILMFGMIAAMVIIFIVFGVGGGIF